LKTKVRAKITALDLSGLSVAAKPYGICPESQVNSIVEAFEKGQI
jgi:hypothetical protein